MLLDRLSEKLRIPKEKIYRSLIRDVGGNCTTVCVQDKAVDKLTESWQNNGIGWVTDTMPSKLDGCKTVILYYGSSTYDTAQSHKAHKLVSCVVFFVCRLTSALEVKVCVAAFMG